MTQADPDLWPVVAAAGAEEGDLLRRVLELQGEPVTAWNQETARSAHDALLDAGSHVLRRALAHPASWDSIVRRVARELGIEHEYVDLVDLEQRVAVHLVVGFLEAAGPGLAIRIQELFLDGVPEEEAEWLQELVELPHLGSESQFERIASVLLARGPEVDDELGDRGRQRVLWRLTARQVKRRGPMVVLTMLGVGIGPWVLAAKAGVLLNDAAGMQLRRVLPAVIWVAVGRLASAPSADGLLA